MDDMVSNELGTRQVSRTFRATLAIHFYASKDERFPREFRITFFDRKCSTVFLKTGSDIPRVLGRTGRASPLNVDRMPNVF